MKLSRKTLGMIAIFLVSSAATYADRIRGAAADMPRPVPAAITGIVSSVSGTLVTVMDGRVVIDTAGARFESRGRESSIAELKPGVRIHAVIRNSDASPGTTLQAVSVMVLDMPDGTLFGPITSLDLARGTLTVLGVTVQVNATTEIHGGRETPPKTLADLKAGDLVSIDIEVTNGGIIASRIHTLPSKPGASAAGIVKSITSDRWILTTHEGREVNIIVNAQTRIDPHAVVGSTVHVLGNLDAAGIIVATEISLARVHSEVNIAGVVRSMSAGVWVLATPDGHEVRVTVDAHTRIDPAIKVGDPVHVSGVKDSSGAIRATSIAPGRPIPPPQHPMTFEGPVVSIGSTEWVVGATKVTIGRGTKIVGSPRVGDTVRVTGHAANGVFAAALIEKKS